MYIFLKLPKEAYQNSSFDTLSSCTRLSRSLPIQYATALFALLGKPGSNLQPGQNNQLTNYQSSSSASLLKLSITTHHPKRLLQHFTSLPNVFHRQIVSLSKYSIDLTTSHTIQHLARKPKAPPPSDFVIERDRQQSSKKKRKRTTYSQWAPVNQHLQRLPRPLQQVRNIYLISNLLFPPSDRDQHLYHSPVTLTQSHIASVKLTFSLSSLTAPAPTSTTKPKPCCVCKEEKAARDDCMLFSNAADPQEDCIDKVKAYKACMKGFGFDI